MLTVMRGAHGEIAKFVDFARSAESKAIFKRCGYIVDIKEVKRYWH